jgi:hypothetical protein
MPLRHIALSVFALGSTLFADELADLREARAQAARRPHRVIFDNDGMDAQFVGTATPEALLDVRTRQLVGTGVSTVFYCSRTSGLGVYTHATKVGEVFDSQVGRYQENITGELIRQGTDPLRVVADFCRANRLEVFWTLRMNDCHDAVHRADRPYPAFSKLKAAHPEWLLGTYEKRPAHGNWSAYDYAVPEVRQLALDSVAEVCRNYDVDGIHLDFFRHLNYFREVAAGGQATPENLELMTDVVRSIRRITEEEGLARQRPFLLAVRVPDSVDYCRALGLDLEQWLKEGLVDLLVVGEFQLRPWSESVELGHRYGTQVIAGLSEGRVRSEPPPFRRDSREACRGRAAAAWSAGCDGLYIFNFYKADHPVLNELHEPSRLDQLAQLHFVTVRSHSEAGRWLAKGSSYASMPLLDPDHPWLLHANRPRRASFELGEPAGRAGTLHACLSLPEAEMRFSLAGHELGRIPGPPGWASYAVPVDLLKAGTNPVDFVLTAEAETKQVFTVQDLTGKWAVRGLAKSESVFEEITPEGLRIVDRGTDSGDYHYRSFGWAVDPGTKAAATVRVKHVVGLSSLAFANGRNEERLLLLPDRIRLQASGLEYVMDTTNAFHDYRVEIDGNDCRVFVDGILRIDGQGTYTAPAASGRIMVLLGAATSSETGEAIWEQAVVETSGVAIRDLVLALP